MPDPQNDEFAVICLALNGADADAQAGGGFGEGEKGGGGFHGLVTLSGRCTCAALSIGCLWML